jgi:RpiB/LacA/LacB family sugar-phosphate isomerase
MTIAANKVKGIRAVGAADIFTAISSRADDDTNVLCLRARRTSFKTVSKISMAWLKARFKNALPYTRRVKKIEEYER